MRVSPSVPCLEEEELGAFHGLPARSGDDDSRATRPPTMSSNLLSIPTSQRNPSIISCEGREM